ncbi:MAG: PA0069 family radical SAM protein [Alphaproteobacteria bacterium]|nr:MAG: PA0069 family radical SAM protein [Alphaproteobacteria bacterium]
MDQKPGQGWRSPEAPRGRGAVSNRAGRFEATTRHRIDDGWGGDVASDRRLVTEVAEDRTRSIIARNNSPDIGFDRSVNPYRGCEHGCIYCFARPTHAFLGLSPGLDFETRILARPQAAELLDRALRAPRYRPDVIAMGTNTDPYQPIERARRITRAVLEVLSAHRHPVSLVTKGALVARDADLLGEMGRAGLASAALSLTSLDNRLSRRMEPRASAPHARLRAIETLARAGCPVGVMLAPLIPALNDHEIERLVQAAADAGASFAAHIVLRLPREVAGLFREWLQASYPHRAARVMRQVRELHGGRDYDPEWGRRLTGEGVLAALIARRVAAARKRHGLAERGPELRRDLFRPPPRAGDQLSLDNLF